LDSQKLRNNHNLRKTVNLHKLTKNYAIIYEIFNLPYIHIPTHITSCLPSKNTTVENNLCLEKWVA